MHCAVNTALHVQNIALHCTGGGGVGKGCGEGDRDGDGGGRKALVFD